MIKEVLIKETREYLLSVEAETDEETVRAAWALLDEPNGRVNYFSDSNVETEVLGEEGE